MYQNVKQTYSLLPTGKQYHDVICLSPLANHCHLVMAHIYCYRAHFHLLSHLYNTADDLWSSRHSSAKQE